MNENEKYKKIRITVPRIHLKDKWQSRIRLNYFSNVYGNFFDCKRFLCKHFIFVLSDNFLRRERDIGLPVVQRDLLLALLSAVAQVLVQELHNDFNSSRPDQSWSIVDFARLAKGSPLNPETDPEVVVPLRNLSRAQATRKTCSPLSIGSWNFMSYSANPSMTSWVIKPWPNLIEVKLLGTYIYLSI